MGGRGSDRSDRSILSQVVAALAGRASPEWRLVDEKQREAHAAAQGATSHHVGLPPLRSILCIDIKQPQMRARKASR